jgi:hypothetical protein
LIAATVHVFFDLFRNAIEILSSESTVEFLVQTSVRNDERFIFAKVLRVTGPRHVIPLACEEKEMAKQREGERRRERAQTW